MLSDLEGFLGANVAEEVKDTLVVDFHVADLHLEGGVGIVLGQSETRLVRWQHDPANETSVAGK